MSEQGREKHTKEDTSTGELESLRLAKKTLEQILYNEQLLRRKQEVDLIKANRELAEKVAILEKASEDARNSRRAALNLMEDAIAAKEALRESEEKYRTLFETMDEGFAIIELEHDGQGNLYDMLYLQANPAFQQHTGLNDPVGKRVSELMPNLEQLIIDMIQRVAETGEPERAETFKIDLQRWFDVVYTRIGGPGSGQVAALFKDITERKVREEREREAETLYRVRLEQEVSERTIELQESRDQLSSILNTTLVQMSILSAIRNSQGEIIDLEIKAVNKELEKETGRNDLVGKLYAAEYPGIKQTGLFELIVKAIETGQPQSTEYFYPHEGFNKWFSCVFVKLGDGVVATNMDITARKNAEQERFKNYLLLQQSEDIAAMGSWDYNLTTNGFTWSDGMYRLFDLEKGIEIRPEIYLEYATENGRAAAERVVQHIRNGETDFEETLELSISGKIKVLRLKAAVIRNAEGYAERVLGVDMDISAIVAAEATIRKMEDEQQLEIFRVILRTQEEERRRISESLHNGLGQTLYGVKMSLSQLSSRHAVENPSQFESSRRYTSDLLSDAIRDSRRISHELMPAVLEEFGLQAAVNDICQQMQNGITFHCSIEVEDGHIDKYMQLAVFRTLQELMLNVVKHSQATEAEAEIRFNDGYILLRVSDNGRGIDPNKQGKDGIGLASIRSKVDLLNGTVDISSSAGKGTTVIIRIPYIAQKNK